MFQHNVQHSHKKKIKPEFKKVRTDHKIKEK